MFVHSWYSEMEENAKVVKFNSPFKISGPLIYVRRYLTIKCLIFSFLYCFQSIHVQGMLVHVCLLQDCQNLIFDDFIVQLIFHITECVFKLYIAALSWMSKDQALYQS